MSCSICTEFTPPGRNAKLIATNEANWADLYRCENCGSLWEVVATEWHANELTPAQAKQRFPNANIPDQVTNTKK